MGSQHLENNRARAKSPTRKRGATSTPSSNGSSPQGNHKRKLGTVSRSKSSNSDSEASNTLPQQIQDTVLPEGDFPGGIETLLPCENRRPLPELPKSQGRKSFLYDIVNHCPQIYQRFITQLNAGASINVAAIQAGLNESTLHDWSRKGAIDVANGVDSYYSRLWLDVRRAIASKTAECERKIADASPTKWLTHGPGRIFGNRWAKEGNKRSLPAPVSGSTSLVHVGANPIDQTSEEVLDAAFTVMPASGEEVDDERSNGVVSSLDKLPQARLNAPSTLSLTPEQEFKALQVWESIGLISINPSLQEAFNEQMTQVVDTDTTEIKRSSNGIRKSGSLSQEE